MPQNVPSGVVKMNLPFLFFKYPAFNTFSQKWLREEYAQKVEERNVQQAIRLP